MRSKALRMASLSVFVSLLPAAAPAAETPVNPSPPATLTIDDDASAAASAAPRGSDAPILQAVTARADSGQHNGVAFDLIPDFHFVAPNGNAIVLRRELIDTSGSISQTNIANQTINIPPAAQKKGAIISGGWRCGTQVYYVTLRASVMDADGNRSNAIQYTIHCNGG